MCIFSGPVHDVNTTSIFTKDLGDKHATVYQMKVSLKDSVAMILPVPGKDLEFLNLENYPEFFTDMNKLFPNMSRGISKGGPAAISFGNLEVHDVGQYIASFAPTRADMIRLDPKFRLPETVWRNLPDYSGFGFAVFQLKANSYDETKFHPMAFKYTPNKEDRLFFPTTHVHDGEATEDAHYDHNLYFQVSDKFKNASWEKSAYTPAGRMDLENSEGLISARENLYKRRVAGTYLNTDHILVSKGGKCETKTVWE